MQVQVLGPIELSMGTGALPVPGRRGALLGALAVRPGAVLEVDALVEGLWGDAPPQDARNALQALVSRLRSQLGGEMLETRPSGYRLAVAPEEVDASRFESLVARSDQAAAPAALALLDEALGLWRGRAFGEHGDSPLVRADAARLEELRLVATERRAARLVELGRVDEAVSVLEPFAAEHPLRSRAVGLLSEALARSGRAPEALRRLHEHRAYLAEETGLEPAMELTDLEAAVLAGALDRPGGTGAGLAGPGPAPTADGAARPPAAGLFSLRLGAFERRPGERVTFGELGRGPLLVFLPGWVSSLDEYGSGADPRGRLIAGLAEHMRVVAYDRYGTGLSAGPVADFALQASVDELVGLLDAIGATDVTLFGSSCSTPTAITVAARDPRVTRLVCFCGFACGPGVFHNRTVTESMLSLVRAGWGMGSRVLSNLLLPERGLEETFSRFQRRAATPEVAAGFLAQMYDADVAALLPEVQTPALVIHYRDDPAIPLAGGHELARGLPRAELLVLPGAYHLPPSADVARIVEAVVAFIGTA